MGHHSVNAFVYICLLLATWVLLFLESTITLPRELLGAHIPALPALMVYTSLRGTLAQVTVLAVFGSLGHGALSADPSGALLLPLFILGTVLHWHRTALHRQALLPRFLLGALASAFVPLLTLFLLITLGWQPLLGLATLWQWLIGALGGGLVTLGCFPLLDHLHGALTHPVEDTPYQPTANLGAD